MVGLKICQIFGISLFMVVFIDNGFVNCGILEDPLLYEVYQSYIKALDIEEGTVSARRVFSNNKNYEIHIIKLDEVNGKKRHNLMVKESNATNPLIYISNPVETKVPHAYLTFEEFKKELTDRVMNARHKFIEDVSKSVATRFNSSNKKKTLDKEKEVKKFKVFLDRLIRLRDSKDNATRAKVKVKYTPVGNATKSTKKASPVFRVYTLQTDDVNIARNNNKNNESVTESDVTTNDSKPNESLTESDVTTNDSKPNESVTESDVTTNDSKPNESYTESDVTTNDSKLNESVTESDQNTNETNPIETTMVMEVTLETPTETTVIDPTQLEITKELLKENSEMTRTPHEIEIASTDTTPITATEDIATEPTRPGKPLVWVQADEKTNEDESANRQS